MPDGKDIDESLLVMLNVLISNKKPEDIPRGLDNFRLMNRIAKAFDNAGKTGVLTLEESDYSFLKKTIESDIPSIWGSRDETMKAVDAFINAKQE